MKKKNLALLGLTALASLSLASCGGTVEPTSSTNGPSGTSNGGTTTTSTKEVMEKEVAVTDTVGGSGGSTSLPNYVSDGVTDSKGLDICLNYSGSEGITLRGNSVFNPVENTNYSQGDLLPTWKAFAANLNTTIRDASSYSAKKDDEVYNAVDTANYVSQTDSSQKIDLFYNTTANIEAMGKKDKAVDLLQYVNQGKMPAFKAWLDANPTMAKAITKGGKIYYTPYFDGYQDVERMFVMDTNVTKAVLDATDFTDFDDIKSGKGGADNTLKEAKYTPYMDDEYNYRAKTTTVPCLDGDKVVNIDIKQTKNIILLQNELLANGCTGKQLAEQFRTYLNAAFGDYIGTGKLFENYSDIFVSESAAYNADELVALMRVVKANPGVVTGDENSEVVGLFPRGLENNRVDNIADFMQIWGVQGMTSKNEMLYFDANGKLNDAASTNQTYDALDNMIALYSEGLILEQFWNNQGGKSNKTFYLDKYFGKKSDGSGYGLLMYDYSAATGAMNSKVDGIGTDDSIRNGGFKDTKVTGVRPILPPLAYWATTSDFDVNQKLTDKTGKTLLRYSEENRSLKKNSWCIPTTSDNIEGAIRLMDYLFTLEGTQIQDFGPSQLGYWNLGTIAGTEAPIMTSEIKTWIGNSGKDFWSFMRAYIGSTHGVGHIRETAIQIQSCNAYAQVGLNYLEDATAHGVVYANRVDKHGSTYSWDCTVPTSGYAKPSDQVAVGYEAVTAFWASDKLASEANGWVAVVKDGLARSSRDQIGTCKNTNNPYTYSSVFEQQDDRLVGYLYTLANSQGSTFVPKYVLDLID